METALPEDFKEFLRLLHANGVEYLLIGGYAIGYYGYPRATNDLDIWIAIAPGNAERMVKTLRDFGFDASQLSTEVFAKEKSLVQMGVEPLKIEVTTFISGVSFEDCYAERVVGMIDGIEINLISLSKLKINKKASGRFKDLNDLEHLP
ncbi:MAG: nucleotidyltransferase [Acidobacteria bacterium]|nr:nucleotidyltransferase [Acidobacteriota bacterium]